MSGDLIWVGLLGAIGCVAAKRTNTLYWLVSTGWCLLYLWVARYPASESGIRELLLAVMLLFAFSCVPALFGLKLWNFHSRKKRRKHAFWAIWWLFCSLLALVTLLQDDVLDYVTALNQTGRLGSRAGHVLLLAFVIFLLWQTGWVVACLVDRLFSRMAPLTLIGCRMSEPPGFVRRYYLQGVHNGTTEYFRVNRPVFSEVKRQPAVRLEVKTGILGGQYVTALPGVASKKQQIAGRDKPVQEVRRHFWRRKIRSRKGKSQRRE